MNVLVTSAGTASAISVIKALRSQDTHPLRVVAVDADNTAPGLYLADDYAVVPKCTHRDYVSTLVQLCQKHQIRALYPIYSREVEIVAERFAAFQECGVALLLPDQAVIRLCNDKRRMYKLAESLGITIPRPAVAGEHISFPVFAKPNFASGSDGAMRINDETDWVYARSRYPDFLYQEFVDGIEYTVDGLCDRQSNLLVGAPRVRLAVKAGQSIKGKTVVEPDLVAASRLLSKAVGMVGPCNVQFIKRRDEVIFVEMNPRWAAGGLMLTVAAGANLPLLALQLMLGEEVIVPPIRAGVVMLRYWEEIFQS